jgi:hypothetical protein
LGVSATAKAVKMVYDVIADRVKSVTLGSVRANIADTIATQQQEILQTPTKTDLRKAQESATAWLTNGKGYAYFRKDDFGNIKDILFMDTKDPETAVNVMRVGQSGIGFSHNGVNGLYESAWTIDGRFVADFITTGSLVSSNGKIKFNLSENAIIIDMVDEQFGGIDGRLIIGNGGITGWGLDKTKGTYFPTVALGFGGIDGNGDGTAPYIAVQSDLGFALSGRLIEWKYIESLGEYVLCG